MTKNSPGGYATSLDFLRPTRLIILRHAQQPPQFPRLTTPSNAAPLRHHITTVGASRSNPTERDARDDFGGKGKSPTRFQCIVATVLRPQPAHYGCSRK